MKLTAKQLATVLVDATAGKEGAELKDAVAAYVKLLAERGEVSRLHEIVRSVDGVWKERFGASTVAIQSASPLSDKLKAVVEKLAHGADVSFRVDPKLIAGAKVRLDDRVIDNTLAGRAERLRQTLLETT
jgi:F-type H+-transporting ATPase subunit delta